MLLKLEELDDYLLEYLVELGYAPAQEEIEDITDIFCEYLIEIGALEDVEEFEEE